MPALSVTDLRKTYGRTEALRGVDLEVAEGELFGLLGPNGAGKSTLVKIACGLVRPTAGGAEIAGAPAGSLAAHRALGYLAELFRFPDWLTRRRGARAAPAARGLGRRRGRARRAARARRARRGAPRSRVGHDVQGHAAAARDRAGAGRLAAAAAARRADERAGSRPAGAPSATLLEELRARGVAVLLNSHLLSEVELVCDRVAIIDRGEVVAAGTPAELAAPGGVEVETAAGAARVRGGGPRGRAADRARARRRGRGGLRRAGAHVLARGRLPRGGGESR